MRAYNTRPHARQRRLDHYYSTPKETKRDYHLRRTHGITLEQFDALLKQQKGCCAICGRSESQSRPDAEFLHVDHDHETKTIRGLLCNNCNCGVGYFGDGNITRARAFVNYLASHEPTTAIAWRGTRRIGNKGEGWHPRESKTRITGS
jgi:hypothetical protein